jgi:hypothetical protein
MEKVLLLLMPDLEMCDMSRTDQHVADYVLGLNKARRGWIAKNGLRKNWAECDRRTRKSCICVYFTS